jgi:2',3'-cyclic-nucleotide 2'-phosphodiesterase (5'-nucleotidase family)
MTMLSSKTPASKTLTLLHTNDFHNHLSASQAAFIKHEKDQLENVLLLDSGDAISAGNVGVRPGGEPILTLMSETGYAAMTLGNREFHVADTLLRLKISKADFPVLCANIRWRDDKGETLPTVPALIKTLPNGLRVGIFGLTVPMVTPRMTARLVSAFVFDDPILAAQEQIVRLRPDVDALIALTHIGLREDERLASACPELDLVIGGHSHNKLHEPQIVNGVPIVQAGWFGHFLGETILTWEEDLSQKPMVTGRLIEMSLLDKLIA